MALYEHIFIARPDLSTQQIEQIISNLKELLSSYNAKVGRVENWGLRTLAYRINKNRKAHYVLMDIDGSHEAIVELERQLRLNEDIMRYMTIKVEEFEKGPSVVMSKKDKDERGYDNYRRTKSENKSSESQEITDSEGEK